MGFLIKKISKKSLISGGIFLFFIFSFFWVCFVFAKETINLSQHKLDGVRLEIQKTSDSEKISLTKKENGKEEISGEIKIIDDYLISDLPENEFLETYPQLKSGIKGLKIEIEADQPIFKKENFYHKKSLSEKLKSLILNERLPDFRLTKEIKRESNKIETNYKISDFNFKTLYRKSEEGKIKQELFLENSSDKQINFQLTFINSINQDNISFAGQDYWLSENPQQLPLSLGSSLSFSSGAMGQKISYDFSDLADFNPEVWVLKRNSENLILTKIYLSVLPHSSLIIDPIYQVDTSSNVLATAWGWQRKAWHDGTRYWVSFWSDADNRVEFWYSASGTTSWTENTAARISIDTNDYSIDCDSTDCFILYATGSNYVYARKNGPGFGDPYPSTNWMWDISYAAGSTSGGTAGRVHLARSRDGYLFASYKANPGFGTSFYVNKSNSTNNISSWGTPVALEGSPMGNEFYGVTVPRGNTSTMLAVWASNDKISSKKFDGSNWDSTAITVGYLDGTTFDENLSAIYSYTDTDNSVHLIYNASSSADSVITYRRWDNEDLSWQTAIEIATSTGGIGSRDYVSLSIDSNLMVLYSIWIEIGGGFPPSYMIKYTTSASPYTSWSGHQTAYTTTSYPMTWLTSNYFPYENTKNDIFAEFILATGTQYNVKFIKIAEGISNRAPSLGTIYLNNNNNINLAELSTTTVSATATVIDTDGYSDIASVEGKIYDSTVGSGCSADYNNCYVPSCATSSCVDRECLVTCTTELWFHAKPTDEISQAPLASWQAWIKATDKSNANSSGTSAGVDVNTLWASRQYNLYERYNTGDDSSYGIGGAHWRAQTFTVGGTGNNLSHNIQGLRIKIGRQGISAGTGTLSIRAIDGSGAPTGTDLTSVIFNGNDLDASEQWIFLPLPPYSLATGTKYSIVLRAPYGNVLVNFLKWFYDSTPGYESGETYSSENSGSSWTKDDTIDFMFEELGTAGINYGNLSPGGNTGSSHEQTIVVNTGNSAIDVYLSGTDLYKQ